MTPEELNRWLVDQRHPDRPSRPIRRFTCPDGFGVSVQASEYHYCAPRETGATRYDSVELGYPTGVEPELLPYAETPEAPTGTVYGYVPVELVAKTLTQHGA